MKCRNIDKQNYLHPNDIKMYLVYCNPNYQGFRIRVCVYVRRNVDADEFWLNSLRYPVGSHANPWSVCV